MRFPFGFGSKKNIKGKRPQKRRANTGRPLRQRLINAAATSDLTFSWSTQDTTIDEILAKNLTATRVRSRDLVLNSDHGRKFIRVLKSQVVGPNGMTLQARCKNGDGSPDTLANEGIEGAFKDWGMAENCSMSGTVDWIEWQELFISSLAQDGEVFFQKIRGASAGPRGFALHQIDPALIDASLNEVLDNGRVIRLGIEVNSWGRPLAYYCLEPISTIAGFTSRRGKKYTRIPAAQIIHEFIKEGPNQTRGIPWMVSAMLRMQMLAGFEEAALVNARLGAAKVGVITTPAGEDFEGDEADRTTGEQIMDAEPGSFINLDQGQEIDSWDPAYPNGEFSEFTTSILRSISAGLGIDYAALTGDLSDTNYSSMRYGLIETRDFYRSLHSWVIRKFCTPTFNEWLEIAILSQAVLSGSSPLPPRKMEKFKKVTWQPRGFAWVDPLKDLNANKLAIDEGIASRSEIIRERGRDPEDVWQEIQRDNQRLEELGIRVGDQAAIEPPEDDNE